jgi:hypothetical protein
MGSHYVCFQLFRDLAAVDPLSGELLWCRHDLPPGCEFFGDDEYVFAFPSDSDEATVLRAWDGEVAGTRKVPRQVRRQKLSSGKEVVSLAPFDAMCLANFGRQLLVWKTDGHNRVLSLFDPWQRRDIWPARKFSEDAVASVLADKAVAVMEPDGRCVLISLPDGRTIADIKLHAQPSLGEVSLFESGDQYFLLAYGVSEEDRLTITSGFGLPGAPRPLAGNVSTHVEQGRLYAFDRQWKLSWPSPVEIKDQFLLARQPSRLPVLTFACLVSDEKAGTKTSVLCVDKRNGRALYKGLENLTGIFRVVGDAEKKTVDLIMQQNTVTLKFADEPN